MRIKTILHQRRRDFTAIYECEHCGFECRGEGYNDVNFHENIVPEIQCPFCEKRADKTYRHLKTKYPEGY